MADTGIAFQEVRINLRDPDLTHVYVLIEVVSGEYMHMAMITLCNAGDTSKDRIHKHADKKLVSVQDVAP